MVGGAAPQADAWLSSFAISVAISIVVLQSAQALMYGTLAAFVGVTVVGVGVAAVGVGATVLETF